VAEHNQEKHAFEQAMAGRVAEHVGAISVEHGDAPDAVLHLASRSVGVEVVSSVDNSWAQAWTWTRESMSPAITSELVRRGVRCLVDYELEVPEHFPPDEQPLSRAQRRQRNAWRIALPQALAELADSSPGVRVGRGELEARGVTGLRSVRIQPSGTPCALPTFYWPGRDDYEGVAVARLRAKEKKLSQYRERHPHLHELWLAIGPFGPGVMEDGGFSFLLNRAYATPFTRVFLVDPAVAGAVVEVSPRG
jgi:hypothetical protein